MIPDAEDPGTAVRAVVTGAVRELYETFLLECAAGLEPASVEALARRAAGEILRQLGPVVGDRPLSDLLLSLVLIEVLDLVLAVQAQERFRATALASAFVSRLRAVGGAA